MDLEISWFRRNKNVTIMMSSQLSRSSCFEAHPIPPYILHSVHTQYYLIPLKRSFVSRSIWTRKIVYERNTVVCIILYRYTSIIKMKIRILIIFVTSLLGYFFPPESWRFQIWDRNQWSYQQHQIFVRRWSSQRLNAAINISFLLTCSIFKIILIFLPNAHGSGKKWETITRSFEWKIRIPGFSL